MYCDYYGFKEKPFQITPNPRFLYLSRNHREAFAHLLYGINSHGGFIKLTGEVGTGKTTVLRTMLEQLGDNTHRTALILNPCLSALELLRNINREFGIPHEGLENGPLLEELNLFLLAENREGRTVVLVIDEAQNLAPQVLEQIRLISNLETDTDKLIQIVLAGQPELNVLLERQELRQLAQRITVSYHLLPMDYDDSANYMQHRLDVAGARGKVDFSPAAMKRIFDFAMGSPRLINLACDRALLVGYGEDTREITAAIAATAIAELRGNGRFPVRMKRMASFIILVCLLLAAVITFGRTSHGRKGETTAAAGSSTAPNWNTLPEAPDSAVNEILNLWGTQPMTSADKGLPVANIVKSRGLSTTPATSLSSLINLNTPAILEIIPGKGASPRFVAIVSRDGERFRISPGTTQSGTVTLGELAAVWNGRGQIIWKNSLKIPVGMGQSASGNGVRKLQNLLTGAGLLTGTPNGIMDGPTQEAIRNLQRSAGLAADGIPGDRTLLVLYRDHGRDRPPRLTAVQKGHS